MYCPDLVGALLHKIFAGIIKHVDENGREERINSLFDTYKSGYKK